MPDYVIHSPQLPRLLQNASKWDDNVRNATAKFLRRGTLKAEELIREEAPKKTGELSRRIRSNITTYRGTVYPTVKYAIYVHEGTRPHIIRPSAKKALYWEGADHPVRMVRHPGTKPNKFVERGADRALPNIEQYGMDLLNDLEKGMTEGL